MKRSIQLPVVARALLALGLTAVATNALRANGIERPADSGWRLSLGLVAREGYDTNVFLQDAVPLATIVDPVRSRQASFVSTVGATIGLERRNSASGTALALSYTPEATVYHSAASESHRLHKFAAGATGQVRGAAWTFQNTVMCIDGAHEGPVFGCEGGAAALAAIPLRDRRDAVVGRSALKVTIPAGVWIVRPVASGYRHDFYTRQSRKPGYLNYIDRQEFVGGVDVGREVARKTRLLVGFRAGRQEQLRLHGVDSPFDSALRRVLVGVEGTPWPGLQVNLSAGPETRRFATGTPVGFDRDRLLFWIDGTATLAITPQQACTVTIRRFEQPAFGSPSVYEDITYDIAWRAKITGRLNATAGFKAYGGDWPGPATREDWILTPSVSLRYVASPRCSVELAYAFDSAESRVAATGGREFRRQVTAVTTQFSY